MAATATVWGGPNTSSRIGWLFAADLKNYNFFTFNLTTINAYAPAARASTPVLPVFSPVSPSASPPCPFPSCLSPFVPSVLLLLAAASLLLPSPLERSLPRGLASLGAGPRLEDHSPGCAVRIGIHSGVVGGWYLFICSCRG